MTRLKKTRKRTINSYRNLETSIGSYRNLIGIYEDHIEIDDELEQHLQNFRKTYYRNLEKTTIGLYNQHAELLAIGKLANPVKNRNNIDMNFLVRVDLDQDQFASTVDDNEFD